MIQQTGKMLRFFFKFTRGGAGADDLAGADIPKVDIWQTDLGGKLVTAQDATALAKGIYYYDYTPAAGAGQQGYYLAQATTADATVDLKDVDALWCCPAWADDVAAVDLSGIALTTDVTTAETNILTAISLIEGGVTNIFNQAGGPGADLHTIQVIDRATDQPVEHAVLWLTNDDLSSHADGGYWLTDAGGMVNGTDGVMVDNGVTYRLWLDHPLYNFELPVMYTPGTDPEPFIVRGDAVTVTGGLDDTLTGLLWLLRCRLNDLKSNGANGAYTTPELLYCINLAYVEIVTRTECRKDTVDVPLVEGTHTYDLTPIFHPIYLRVTGQKACLEPFTSKGKALEIAAWDEEAAGADNSAITDYTHIEGNKFRIHKPPKTAGTLRAHGFAAPTPLVAGADVPDAIPAAYRVPAILTRAEAEARRMRSTAANDLTLSDRLEKTWEAVWLVKIIADLERTA